MKRLFRRTNQLADSRKEMTQLGMCFLALAVGLVAGFGAVFFRDLIGLIHNFAFFGTLSAHYDANVHTPMSAWGAWVIGVPMIGGLVVVWLVKTFAPEAKGHGVPEVMYSIYMQAGKIRPVVAVVKAVASAFSIGTGGSVGREGPIVQIGSTFGSFIGRVISMPMRQRNILIAAGAAAGIAATFNTPVGALAFAMELMLTSVSASSLFVVATATVWATYIGRYFLGTTPSFYIPALTIPNYHIMGIAELAIFLPFGFAIGLCSVVFIRGLYWCEDKFELWLKNDYVRHVLAMMIVGIVMYVMMQAFGHYYVQGVGYATIVDILKGVLTSPWLLLLLLLAKLFSTFLTLGSGGSGGIFSPSLYLGACLGGTAGDILHSLFPSIGANPVLFAMAGMAGMVGSSTGAVLTAITMVTEMTRSGNTVLPIIITVGAAFIVRKIISNESIYTLKLLRRGHVVPEGLQAAVAVSQRAGFIMNNNFTTLTLAEVLEGETPTVVAEESDEISIPDYTLVSSEEDVYGVLERQPLVLRRTTAPQDNIAKDFVLVSSRINLPNLLRLMKSKQARYALVTLNPGQSKMHQVMGVIGHAEILKSSQQAYAHA